MGFLYTNILLYLWK